MPTYTQGFTRLQRRLRFAKSRVRATMRKLVRSYAELIVRDAKRNAPTDTGELSNAFGTWKQGLMAVAYNTAEHAKPIEFGSRPHEITPNDAGALHFFWEKIGQEVFFAQVDHPGNESYDYFRDAIQKQWPHFLKSMKRQIRSVFADA